MAFTRAIRQHKKKIIEMKVMCEDGQIMADAKLDFLLDQRRTEIGVQRQKRERGKIEGKK